MKTKLLLPALLLSICAFAQEPIYSFYNLSSPESADGYELFTSPTTIDQGSGGASVEWNFTDLVSVGQSGTQVFLPTPEELIEYPGSTLVVSTVMTGGETNYYLSVNDAGTSLTGAVTSGAVLNYTDNAFIGDFPLAYGYTNTDAVAGTFEMDGIEGTFTGTANVSLDAYGSLSVNDADAINVTRLKTVQELTLIYMGIDIGTVTQIMHSYYTSLAGLATGGPIFRSITNHVVVPSLSIDETTNAYELYTATLGINNPKLPSNKLSIVPNPVNNIVHFEGSAVVNTVTITDVTGKIVLTANEANNVDVSTLNPGIYFVSAQSDKGVAVTKIVKQ